MSRRPVILISAHTESAGSELADASISLSCRYAEAVAAAGGLPVVLPPTADLTLLREAVAGAWGVLLSGGDDVHPERHRPGLPETLRRKADPAHGGRDEFEAALIAEAFTQQRPLLGICRGHQMVNVALGGTLVVDLPVERPAARGHNQPRRRFEPVHEIEVAPDSALARITGAARLGVNSTHHQAVDVVAGDLRVTARSPDGIVEALELDPGAARRLPFLLTVQFHPERLYDRHPEHRRLFEAFIAAARAAA